MQKVLKYTMNIIVIIILIFNSCNSIVTLNFIKTKYDSYLYRQEKVMFSLNNV